MRVLGSRRWRPGAAGGMDGVSGDPQDWQKQAGGSGRKEHREVRTGQAIWTVRHPAGRRALVPSQSFPDLSSSLPPLRIWPYLHTR